MTMDNHGSVNSNIKPVVFDPKFTIPNEIVDDVICRFLLNIPKHEKFDSVRVCFQIELAHWFFLDFHCGEGCSLTLAQLRNIPYNQFAYLMFQKTPHLRPRLPEIDKHLAAFREYKMRVPTYGAILMDQNLRKCVLVQGFRNNWGFPKGKVNEVEDPVSCAIREVFEETGYDMTALVNKDHYIESRIFERNDRLYLVRGVDLKYPFQAQTQFEIKNIKWFNIDELPEHKKDTNPAIARSGVPISNFYSVYTYIKRLKVWIADKLEGKNKIQHFKVRPENEDAYLAQQQLKSSGKSAHQQPYQKSGKNSLGYQNQFQTHFLPPAGGALAAASTGWQLFPMAVKEQNPYAMTSNALQELLLNSNRQGQASGSGNANANQNTKGNSKNARRRLFSEDGGGGTNGNRTHHSKAVGNKSCLSFVNSHASVMGASNKIQSQQYQADVQRNPLFNSSAWANFSFDRERIYKAFFNPP